MKTRTLVVDALARVEGEGALTLRVKDGVPAEVQLRIFEPPRFFEALLVGRSRLEAPDITSRICGICPVAYLLSACHAVEDASGVRVDGPIRALRRLLYCGEWIASHALHVFFLHLPDFLDSPDAFAVAEKHPERMRDALRMKKAGNAISIAMAGREIHPVNVRVGGFYRAPRREELLPLLPELRWGASAAREALLWAARLPFPDFERDWELVSLSHPDEYPMCEGRIVSSGGLDIAVGEFEKHLVEEQAPYSTALRAALRGRGPYLTGPLARFSLNHEKLAPVAREAARQVGLAPPVRNPFKSILVRLVEMLHAFDEAARLVEGYQPPERSSVEVAPVARSGTGCTEAPRGSLYHRYTLDAEGTIRAARIVPPTAQNQRSIESDLWALAPRLLALPRREATRLAEHAIRNHDPCISCSAHFLKLSVTRE